MLTIKQFFVGLKRQFQLELVWKLRKDIFSEKIRRGIALINASR